MEKRRARKTIETLTHVEASRKNIPTAEYQAVMEDADLAEVYDTERHLLYVVCTRARDRLMLTGVAPASEFLDDLLG